MKMFSHWRGHAKSNSASHSKSFGVPLTDAPRDGGKIPVVLEKMINHLQETAIDTEGLFRISGSLTAINELIKAMDAGQEVNLNHQDQHTVAGLLKRFFRDLPEPLIPTEINQRIAALFGSDTRKPIEENMYEMRECLYSLPEVHFDVLKSMMSLLADIIKHSDRNKMTLSNVAICIVPSLDCVPAIVTYTLQNYDFFFKEPLPVKEPLPLPQAEGSGVSTGPQAVEEAPSSPPTPAMEKQAPAPQANGTHEDGKDKRVTQEIQRSLDSEERVDRKYKDKHKEKRRAHKRSRDKERDDDRQNSRQKDIADLQTDIRREREKYDYYNNKNAELEHKLKKEEDYSRTLLSDYERLEHKLRKIKEEYNSATSDEHKHRSVPRTPRSNLV